MGKSKFLRVFRFRLCNWLHTSANIYDHGAYDKRFWGNYNVWIRSNLAKVLNGFHLQMAIRSSGTGPLVIRILQIHSHKLHDLSLLMILLLYHCLFGLSWTISIASQSSIWACKNGECDGFRLHVDDYTADALDSRPFPNGMKFTTNDRDNKRMVSKFYAIALLNIKVYSVIKIVSSFH